MSIYIENEMTIECQYSWNNLPNNINECKKCNEKHFCPLSLYKNEEKENKK